jgi:adenosylcobinamide-GDP ribazoletransferase
LITAFWVALGFLTCLPVPRGLPHGGPTAGHSVVMYPLVGLVVGALCGIGAALFDGVGEGLRAAIVVTLWVALTGGLHLDGVADWADAWAGGRGDRAKSLALLEDPHAGTMAIVALVLLLLVKFAALAETLGGQAYAPLILAPVLGRTAVTLVLLTTAYVRMGGLGSELVTNLPRRAAIGSAGVAFVVCAFGLGVFATAGALATVYLLRRFMIAHLGGCTGDTLGATVEVVEAAILVTAASGL